MQTLECTGLWWLPQDEASYVGGTLRISANGDLTLSLVGALGPVEHPFGNKNHNVILGSVDKSPGGNEVSLVGCMRTQGTFGSFAGAREVYHASRGYFGAHLSKESDFAFKELRLTIGGLTEWAHPMSGFGGAQIARFKPGEKFSLVEYTPAASVGSPAAGGEVSLALTLKSQHGLHKYAFEEEAYLSVECERVRSADELNGDYAYPLQNLMTFVCDRPQRVEEFSVYPATPSRERPVSPIQVIGARVQPEDDEEAKDPVRRFQMLFTLQDADFAVLVAKWFQLMERYDAACNIYFGLKYGPPAYVDMTFAGMAQVLHLYYSRRDDGMARRAAEIRRLKEILAGLTDADSEWVVNHVGANPYPTFDAELRELLNEHAPVMNPLVSNRPDRFVNEVTNSLHYIIHREPEMYAASGHGADLYWALEKLRFLVKACFLAELGFSGQKSLDLFGRNAMYQHVRQQEALRESQSPSTLNAPPPAIG